MQDNNGQRRVSPRWKSRRRNGSLSMGGFFCWTLACWTLALILRVHGDKYPLLNEIPKSNFTCDKRTSGYYADDGTEARCQVYHMCNPGGRRYSYLCPNHTLFNQDKLICDHWYRVNCTDIERRSKINVYLFANDLIGKVSGKVVFPVTTGKAVVSGPATNTSRGGTQRSGEIGVVLRKRCSGCLEHFMRDASVCSPCVLPR